MKDRELIEAGVIMKKITYSRCRFEAASWALKLKREQYKKMH